MESSKLKLDTKILSKKVALPENKTAVVSLEETK